MYSGIFNFVGLWLNIDERIKDKTYMLNGYNTQLYKHFLELLSIYNFYCTTIYNIGK